MRLPTPPRFEKIKGLQQHFLWIQQELEREDAKNLKLSQAPQGGDIKAGRIALTADAELAPGISFVEVDTTGSSVTVTLPSFVNAYRMVTICNCGTGTLTIDGNSTNIVGSPTLVGLAQYDAVRLWPGATEWLLG
jgi:hypothetical protein